RSSIARTVVAIRPLQVTVMRTVPVWALTKADTRRPGPDRCQRYQPRSGLASAMTIPAIARPRATGSIWRSRYQGRGARRGLRARRTPHDVGVERHVGATHRESSRRL